MRIVIILVQKMSDRMSRVRRKSESVFLKTRRVLLSLVGTETSVKVGSSGATM
jgi:hypothetical protein